MYNLNIGHGTIIYPRSNSTNNNRFRIENFCAPLIVGLPNLEIFEVGGSCKCLDVQIRVIRLVESAFLCICPPISSQLNAMNCSSLVHSYGKFSTAMLIVIHNSRISVL
jgi:hypothetical protein